MTEAIPKHVRLANGKITLFARELKGSTIYYARFKVANPKTANELRYLTESMKTGDFDIAKDRAFERYGHIRALESAGKALRSATVATEIQAFIAEYEKNLKLGLRGYSPHMLRGFRKTIVRYFIEYVGGKKLQDVSIDDLRDYEAWRQQYWQGRREKGLVINPNARDRASDRTLEWEINAFKQFLKWALIKGKYSGSALNFSFKQREHARRSAFSDEQVDKFTELMLKGIWLNAGKHKHDSRIKRQRYVLRAYVLFMLGTGMRVGEARHLRWEDVNVIQTDKGDWSVLVRVPSSRSKVRRAREVVGNLQAWAALETLKEDLNRLGETIAPRDFVWSLHPADIDARKKKNSSYVAEPVMDFREGFNSLLREAKTEFDPEGGKLTVYSLRHTYITRALRGGVDIYRLARNCGTSVSMIEKHYAHVRSRDFVNELIRGEMRLSDVSAWLEEQNKMMKTLGIKGPSGRALQRLQGPKVKSGGASKKA